MKTRNLQLQATRQRLERQSREKQETPKPSSVYDVLDTLKGLDKEYAERAILGPIRNADNWQNWPAFEGETDGSATEN